MNRRQFLAGTGAAALLGPLAARSRLSAQTPSAIGSGGDWPLVNARPDRIIRMTVCLRPFRATGPNLNVEKVGDKTVVHNYGHGGSGWSLSWGSGTVAVAQALATGEREFAVIGCGAMGLTSAILLQRAGVKATIYAKNRPPEVFSANATGVWSPDSRISLRDSDTPAWAAKWEEMCRTSFRTYQSLLSLPGQPVEWFDRYTVSDVPYEEFRRRREEEEVMHFSRFQDRVKDLTPASEDLVPWKNPFAAPYVRRATTMMFNLSAYMQFLTDQFIAEGGRIQIREFHDPSEFRTLPEKTIIHATGYGAKALFKDDTVVPVRGQLAALIPQSEIRYGVVTDGVSMVPRRDGIIVQASLKSDYGSTDLTPHREETEQAVAALAKLNVRMRG